MFDRLKRSSQPDEQRLCLFQVLGVEAFGEPVVDRCEEFLGLRTSALPLPEAGEIDRLAQFHTSRFDG